MIATWLFALAAAAPGDLQAPSTPVEIPVSSSRLALATRLIDVILPDQVILQTNMNAWEAGLKAAQLNNPGIAKIEAENPGAIASAIDAGRPVARPYIWSQLIKAKAVKAKITADMLDEAELQEVMDFYSSPTGQRFIHSITAKADPNVMANTLIDRANETGEVTVTDEDGQKVLRGALRETLKTLSAADMVEIMKFEAKPVAKKMAEAGRKSDLEMLEIFNTLDPVFMEAQHKAVTDALLAHIGKNQAPQK